MATSLFPLRELVGGSSRSSTASAVVGRGKTRTYILEVRAIVRGILLVTALIICAVRFVCVWLNAMRCGRRVTARQRAEWMHFSGELVLAVIGIRYRVEGAAPAGVSMMVANHLSYLDIVIFSAALPCSFVAKQEIAMWPAFGRLARLGGTIFVDRGSRLSAFETTHVIAERLEDRVPVLVFPEGTSTDGLEVQRFHAPLLEAAIQSGSAITPASISYQPGTNGLSERHMCWYGDDLFLPHLKRVLGMDNFSAVIRFGEPEVHFDRKVASWRTHDAVEALRQGNAAR